MARPSSTRVMSALNGGGSSGCSVNPLSSLLLFLIIQARISPARSLRSLLPSDAWTACTSLDCLYLDTTFATKSDPYREFPSKADGLTEMLATVARYPAGTNFYLDSGTFGYEDVWQTLSTFLHAQIHVDDYRMSLYQALLRVDPRPPEVAKLIGYQCGNHIQRGCLTRERSTQLHSCERGTGCAIWSEGKSSAWNTRTNLMF